MNNVGKPELETQRRVIGLFRDELDYRFLGNWTDRDGDTNPKRERGIRRLTNYSYSSLALRVSVGRWRFGLV